MDRLQTDKAKFSRRITKLVHNGNIKDKNLIFFSVLILAFHFKEKELIQELQKIRRTTKSSAAASSGSPAKKLTISARVDAHLKNVEDERDMYKNEVEILQRLLNERPRCASSLSPSRLRGRSISPTNLARSATKREMATSPVMQYVKRSASSCATSPTRCTVCGLNRNRLSPTKVVHKDLLFLIRLLYFIFFYFQGLLFI